MPLHPMHQSQRPRLRLGVFAPHPVQYHAGIYRELAKLADMESLVFYEDHIGLEPVYVAEFKTTIQWDVDLLKGYEHRFLKNLSWNPQGRFFARINPGVVNTIRKGRFDAILITGYNRLTEWLAFITARMAGVPILFRGEATLDNVGERPSLRTRLKGRYLARVLEHCDAVLYSCRGNKEYFRRYGVPDEKMLLNPCAVDNDFFRRERHRYAGQLPQIRSELGIAPSDFVIVFAARMLPLKRDDDLIEAVSRIDHDNIVLLFIGEGPTRARAETLSQQRGVRSVFTGFINQGSISRYYSIGNLFTMLSDRDRSPKAMNEAMNFAMPLICTRVTGTAYDLVEDGKNGFLVDAGDVETIAQKIDHLNRNRDVATAMGERSLEIVQDWNFEADARAIRQGLLLARDNHARRSLPGFRR